MYILKLFVFLLLAVFENLKVFKTQKYFHFLSPPSDGSLNIVSVHICCNENCFH